MPFFFWKCRYVGYRIADFLGVGGVRVKPGKFEGWKVFLVLTLVECEYAISRREEGEGLP